MKRLFEQFISGFFALLDKGFVKKKYIVFSCRSAKFYADNSKILFEKFIEEGHAEVFFYTKKKEILEQIPQQGIYAYSIKALLILLRSKVLVFTHGSKDFFPFTPPVHKNRTFINLFHAIAVKKVGHRGVKQDIEESQKWDYFITSSPFESDFIKEQYTLKEDKILVSGQPRNDILSVNLERTIEPKVKRILYAPTFRDSGLTELFPFADKNLNALDSKLKELNIELMIRMHINEERHYSNKAIYKDLEQIYFAGSDIYPNVNSILHEFDGLITDYSSVTMDYLLLNRPMAFIPYDFRKYELERGFSFDYYKHLGGDVLTSQVELIKFVAQETDSNMHKRVSLVNLFHTHQDGKATERLYKFICDL